MAEDSAHPNGTQRLDVNSLALHQERRGRGRRSVCEYRAYCFLVSTTMATVAILTLSSVGFGRDVMVGLRRSITYRVLPAVAACGILLVLVILDFFAPPYLPGKHCILWEGDLWIGPTLLGIAILGLVCSCFMSADSYPSAPALVAALLCPIALLAIHALIEPKAAHPKELERDQRDFSRAGSFGFLVTALLCLGIWVPWAMFIESHEDITVSESDYFEREVQYIIWATPLIIASSYLVFASMFYLRVYLNKAYRDSCRSRDMLEADTARVAEAQKELEMYELDPQPTIMGKTSYENVSLRRQATQATIAQYQKTHALYMKRLARITNVVGCTLVFQIGVAYITFQLVAVDSHLAGMIQLYLCTYFLFFIAFVLLSFRGFLRFIVEHLNDSSLWQKAIEMTQSNFFKACLLCGVLPAIPIILFLSLVTQAVRKCRGTNRKKADPRTPQNAGLLTERVQRQLDVMVDWEWAPILSSCYILALAMVCLVLSPRLLNVFLSWVNELLSGVDFSLLLGLTFLIGMGCFLLPPVPGAPVYFFAGAIATGACPMGFWWGVIISIFLGWFMKLAACAMQQSGIGGLLGGSTVIKQACGVHKPFIRTIECVLRHPGLDIGKVAILCGGPDWPTSVLAGILKLSLVQCELGTLPIIFFIMPFSLSGSFYLRRNDGDVWIRIGNLMFTLTGLVCAVMWVIMAWAWQKEFNQKQVFVTKPMAKYIDLDWCDFRAEEIRKNCEVRWHDVPRSVKIVYITGAVALTLVCHTFWFMTDSCFGSFAVTDPINTLVWYGDDGICKLVGLIGLCVTILSCVGLFIFKAWRSKRISEPIKALLKELDRDESSWKARRLAEIRKQEPASNGSILSYVSRPSFGRPLSVGSNLVSKEQCQAVAASVNGGESNTISPSQGLRWQASFDLKESASNPVILAMPEKCVDCQNAPAQSNLQPLIDKDLAGGATQGGRKKCAKWVKNKRALNMEKWEDPDKATEADTPASNLDYLNLERDGNVCDITALTRARKFRKWNGKKRSKSETPTKPPLGEVDALDADDEKEKHENSEPNENEAISTWKEQRIELNTQGARSPRSPRGPGARSPPELKFKVRPKMKIRPKTKACGNKPKPMDSGEAKAFTSASSSPTECVPPADAAPLQIPSNVSGESAEVGVTNNPLDDKRISKE